MTLQGLVGNSNWMSRQMHGKAVNLQEYFSNKSETKEEKAPEITDVPQAVLK